MKTLLLALTLIPLGFAASVPASAGCKVPPPIPVCHGKLAAPEPPGDLSQETPLRQKIVAAAISKIGAVSEMTEEDCQKHGWRDLVDFYRTAYGREMKPKEIKILQQPFFSRKSVTKLNDWCGIFALWAVKTGSQDARGKDAACPAPPAPLANAAADFRGIYLSFTRWVGNKKEGGGIDGLPYKAGRQGIRPGDIVHFTGETNHHAVVERIVGGKIYTVDGNMDCQLVMRKARDLSEVSGYYPVE